MARVNRRAEGRRARGIFMDSCCKREIDMSMRWPGSFVEGSDQKGSSYVTEVVEDGGTVLF
jgi:hypothetical protein